MNNNFIFLDWNSASPLAPSVRKAMENAFDLFGNPSSIHLEGRRARKIIEDSRSSIENNLDVGDGSLIFTSGATEAAQIILKGKKYKSAAIEHPAVLRWTECSLGIDEKFQVVSNKPQDCTIQLANSETGIVQENLNDVWMTDATQYFPKMNLQFSDLKASCAILSPHKFGGPKGIGAIIAKNSSDLDYLKHNGSQEEGVRPGTENVIGVVGFSEAVKIAKVARSDGIWERILELRNLLEFELKLRCPDSIVVGENVKRLPNTSCILTPGWSGEKQVISLDLAGFGVSFGSACSGKVSEASKSLIALGYSKNFANCAIRVSIGPITTQVEIEKFIEAWHSNFKKQSLYAA
tara:strand:+ start:577 stop:1626 length:1050 start_codon:yes stop_codon:yes gene_type:complete